MKLICCPECSDIIKLTLYEKFCYCGNTSGYYNPDGDTVTISHGAILMVAWEYPDDYEKITRKP